MITIAIYYFVLNIANCKSLKKLMTTLYSKGRYVIPYRSRIQALKHGMVLKKIQSSWLKSYTDLNTKLRTKATTDFEHDLLKSMMFFDLRLMLIG